ncbi:hypothetical protein PL321_18145 [Caloramator sp. mosi_1]|nr:hypothetical protein [Caloramator sp. mosi_1]WDC84155.1 hypothetical protein PL321_18145 [Caloramator sp. mosi_1]
MNIYRKNNDLFISNHSFELNKISEEDLKTSEHIFLLKNQEQTISLGRL